MPLHLSPTRLNLLAECARCFWLRVNEGRRRPSAPFPSLPGGMDRAIKEHFDGHRATGTVPPALRDAASAVLDSTPALAPDQALVDRCRRWQADPVHADEALDVVVHGGVDDLLRDDDGSLVVLDYKTRGYPPDGVSGAPDYYTRQLDCYALILRSAGHATADYGLLLYFYPDALRDDGAVGFHTEARRVQVDVDVAKADVERAVRTARGRIPDAAPDCAFCAWNRDTRG